MQVKAFYITEEAFLAKIPRKIKTEGHFQNLFKSIYKKFTPDIRFSGERLCAWQGKDLHSCYVYLTFTGSPSQD